MARQKNDGKGRLGGRTKGTPNKVTKTAREWLTALVDKNRRQIERDLKQLEPKERLLILEKLLQYVIPKKQAVDASVSLENLSDEQLDFIIDEITKDDEPGQDEQQQRSKGYSAE